MAQTKLLSSIVGRREWLLTDGTGGYALGCTDGMPRRRYHAFLTLAALPPIRRILTLGFVEERLQAGASESIPFDIIDPLAGFEHNTASRPGRILWRAPLGHGLSGTLTRELILENGKAALHYRFDQPPPAGTRLSLRPVLYQRCHHRTLGLDAFTHVVEFPQLCGEGHWSLRTSLLNLENIHFHLAGCPATVTPGTRKYLITYETEVERGFEREEEVESDFEFQLVFDGTCQSVAMTVSTDCGEYATLRAPHSQHVMAKTVPSPSARDRDLWEWMQQLSLSGNDFVVRGRDHTCIMAGYPWFGSWARDTFLALKGFCLLNRRFNEARSILEMFASHMEKGLVPNRFYMAPDRIGYAKEYNSADATMWFLNGAAEYCERSNDREFALQLIVKVDEIVDWHERGTLWNIRLDAGDGLIYAGHHGVPLTWMHACIGDHCFTPRSGKPIEVNALWISALRRWARLARTLRHPALADKWDSLARKANAGFQRFWNESYGWWADVVDTPMASSYGSDLSLRPNQVIALSLPEVEISPEKRQRALRAVRENLLTPIGLRGLSPRDPRYRPVYSGSPEQRDLAYHNGPAWPWLLGPYLGACRLADGASADGHIREVLVGARPFFGRDCLGHLAEIYDGEYPFPSRGCPAHAAAAAQLLTALAETHFGLSEIPT